MRLACRRRRCLDNKKGQFAAIVKQLDAGIPIPRPATPPASEAQPPHPPTGATCPPLPVSATSCVTKGMGLLFTKAKVGTTNWVMASRKLQGPGAMGQGARGDRSVEMRGNGVIDLLK